MPTSDGGAILVGYRVGIGPGQGTIFLMKVGPNDNYPVVSDLAIITAYVGIEDVEEIEGIALFPNPVEYSFTIELPEQGQYEIQLMNAMGQEVRSETIFGSKVIDVSDLASGFYTVVVRDDSNRVGKYRLIVK